MVFSMRMYTRNLFVTENGGIAAVDFGIMGRLDINPTNPGEMLLAFLTRDYRRAAEIHFEAGWVLQPINRRIYSGLQINCRANF